MNQKLKILHLEDLPADAEMVERELKKGEIAYESLVVSNKKDYTRALKDFVPDIVLSDHSLPMFDSREALHILKTSGIKIPFVLVTSTISEEYAVEIMKDGAYDYVLKDRLARLPAAVLNAMQRWKTENDKQKYLDEIVSNEALLKEAEHMARFGSWQTDLVKGSSKWSDESYRILGYKPGEIKPSFENFLENIHPEDRAYVKDTLDMAIRDLNSHKLNFRVIDKDGVVKYIRSELVMERNKEKQAFRITGFNQDITEMKLAEDARRKAERELQSTNERLLFHIENTPLGFIEWDNQLRIKALSKRAEEIFGWSMKEFKESGRTGYTQVYEDDIPWMSKIAEQLLSGTIERNRIQHRNYRKDGTVIWCEWFNSVMKDKDGKVATIMSLVQDITEQKKAEENLKQSEARLKEAQALSHISNWEIDLITNVNTWSDEFYNIFGIKRGYIEPSPEAFLSFIHPDDFDYAKRMVEDTFQTLKSSHFYSRAKKKDGRTIYIYAEWRFEFDNNNKPIRLFGILQDITERKIAEEEREKMTADIIQRNKDLEQFAYIVSHNLRAPVANIIGLSELMKDSESAGTEERRMMTELSSTVKKLDNVIKDLNFILQVKRELNERKEPVKFSELIDDIQISIDNLIRREHVHIKIDFSEIDEMMTLKSYLHSIFFNLISNSIKYRQPDLTPVIEIKSAVSKDKITITFSDNGLGIDLKKRGEQVFGLYKRFHSHAEGKGMGLFMVKTQVETLGGKISIQSEVNKGTAFKIEFENAK